MKIKPFLLMVIGFLFLADSLISNSWAVEQEKGILLQKGVSLEHLISIALARNPKLKAAKAKWKAVIERYPQATAFDDPEIGVDTWNIPTDFSLTETRTTIFWITQKFPFPGKLEIKGDIVSQEAKVARTRFEIDARELLAELAISYYELLYLDKAIAVIRKNKKLAEHLAKISATEYSTKATTLNDVLKAQSQLAQLDNDLILLIELRINEVANINTLLDLPPDQLMGSPEEVAFIPFDISLKQLYQLAREHQQELKINGFEIEKSQKRIELAEKQYLPDFRATFKYFNNNGISMDQGLGILFGMKIPIWSKKNHSRVSQAQNNLLALKFEKKDLENKAFSRINKIYFKIQNSSRLVRLYKKSLIPQAFQSLEIAETWYKQKKASFAGLLEARSVWLNFNLAYQRALADYFQNLIKLEQLIGFGLQIAKNKENSR